jgi:FeS assembly SUF system protein
MSEAAPQVTEQLSAEEAVRAEIVRMLRTVFDPEIPVNIYDMGLIYGIDLTPVENGAYDAHIRMTLTSPNCPAAAELPANVQAVTGTVEQVAKASVDIVWDPPWSRAMMSEEATLSLGFF